MLNAGERGEDIEYAFLNDRKEAFKLALDTNKKIYLTGTEENRQYFVGSASQAWWRLNFKNMITGQAKRIY